MRCGWCGTEAGAGEGRTHCTSCGGPLPAPQARGTGPAPPPAPREVPAAFVRRVSYRNPSMTFGLVVTVFGTLLSLPFLVVGLFVPPMLFGLVVTGFWPLFGAWATVRSWRKGQARLEVLRGGRATTGQVTAVGEGSVTYVYDVVGQRYAGVVEVAEGAAPVRVDQRLHVLFLADHPERSEVWPLLG